MSCRAIGHMWKHDVIITLCRVNWLSDKPWSSWACDWQASSCRECLDDVHSSSREQTVQCTSAPTHTHTHAQTQRLIHVVFDYSTLTSLFELQGNAKNELAAVNAKDAKYFTRYSNNNCTNWTELNWIETLLYAKPATDEESRPAGVACRRPCWRWRWTRCSRAVWVVIEVGPPAVTSSSRAPPVDLCRSTQPPSCVVQTIVSCAVTGGRRLAGGSRRSSSLTSRRRPPVSGTDASGVTVSSRHCCGLSRRSQTRRDLHTHTHTHTHTHARTRHSSLVYYIFADIRPNCHYTQ